MTNTEAIDIIQDEAYFLFEDDSPYNRQAFDKAVYALEFLDFLYNHINPNDMEMYRAMFESKANGDIPTETNKSKSEKIPIMLYPQVDGITPTVVAVKGNFRDTWDETKAQ